MKLMKMPTLTRFSTLATAAMFMAAAAEAQTAVQPPQEIRSDAAAMARARSDSARYPYTAADVEFMTGMIIHHTQAIVMSHMAPTHGANRSVSILAERIINAQEDEIATTQQWLSDRGKLEPDEHNMGMKMNMAGAAHGMLMPGMLTDSQMKQLDKVKGKDFDKLFLTSMIQHHLGAVAMVSDLFETYGAAQDQTVFKFANDVNVDQTTEIARMKLMLSAYSTPPQK